MIGEYGSTFTITGSAEQRIVMSQGLPRGGIRALLLSMTGSGNGPQYMAEIVLKIENDPIICVTGTQLRAILEALLPHNVAPAADALYVPIPLDLPRAVGAWGAPSPVGGIPQGVNLTLEVLWSSSCATGTMRVGWIYGPAAPAYLTRLIKSSTGVGASQAPGRIELNRGAADVLGVLLPNGTNKLTYAGPIVSAESGIVSERVAAASILTALRSVAPGAITDPLYLPFPSPVKLGPGSRMELWTGSAGAASDEYVLVEAVPLR